MKKILVIGLAVLLVGAFALPASALENEFGGYWRTRFYTEQNFTGEDESEASDVSLVDTRTRLYYTAIINDNLKFVNKFEMDATWGDSGYGDIGTDGKSLFEIKHSYADFSIGDYNFKVGAQGKVFARGFLFDDDFMGLIVRYVSDDMIIPFIWMKAYEGGAYRPAASAEAGWDIGGNDQDVDYFGLDPRFNVGNHMINPFVLYVTSSDGSQWAATTVAKDISVFYLGVNMDLDFDVASVWFTGIYSGGSIDASDWAADEWGIEDFDVSAYLIALGASVDLSAASIHGQLFLASGDDDALDDNEASEFFVPKGQSYYWSEIMGYGTFDYQVSSGSIGDQISNIMAANIGVDFAPTDKLKLTADLWYAKLVEEDANGKDVLGTEIDLKASYELVEGLNMDVIAAYLFAGDATYDGANDADPYELGMQLSLKF